MHSVTCRLYPLCACSFSVYSVNSAMYIAQLGEICITTSAWGCTASIVVYILFVTVTSVCTVLALLWTSLGWVKYVSLPQLGEAQRYLSFMFSLWLYLFGVPAVAAFLNEILVFWTNFDLDKHASHSKRFLYRAFSYHNMMWYPEPGTGSQLDLGFHNFV